MLQFFRKYHKWPSLFFSLFILLFAFSGIVLNHRELLSSVDVSRKWLPRNYSYKNWNLAAVKGSASIGPDSMLVYGNIGVWLTDSTFRKFLDFNAGFPKGADNRKVNSVAVTGDHRIFAGTLFGLYKFEGKRGWTELPLPVPERRIVKVLVLGDSLLVMTRSNILQASLSDKKLLFSVIKVPVGEDDDNQTSLFKTLWVIHSGEIYGTAGKLIVDGAGLIFILLTITGLIYFFMPYTLKRVKREMKSKLKHFNRFSLRWHNRIGAWTVLLLVLTTLTGMFLRPPLLIPIAGSRVGKIRFSELDNPNPWFDKFRDMLWDDRLQRFIIASNEGIYYSDDTFRSRLKRFHSQPPVSVMGINVLEKKDSGTYLVGSFSGIFEWIPDQDRVIDYITKTDYIDTGQGGPPFGAVTVAGYIKPPGGGEFVFDYAAGCLKLGNGSGLPEMPSGLVSASPVSLWNASLEIHTGRIFEPLLGPFYILVVPLCGLAILLIQVTGFFAWWLGRKRKKSTL
jgi:hypothetical protein